MWREAVTADWLCTQRAYPREVFVKAEVGVNSEPRDEILNKRDDNLIMCRRLGQDSIN